MSQFIYLLNAMENAVQASDPSTAGYGTARRAVLEYVENLESARPEVVQNGWNDAIAAASKMLRSSADNCQPGSPAETHNWPFVLETMARKVEGLKQTIPSPLRRSECPYCTSDNEAIRGTYYDQTCEGCVKRMGQS